MERKPRKKKEIGRSEVYTTGEVGKILHVGMATVSKLIDSGRLQGYCIPRWSKRGKRAGDRRVTHQSLVDFMREHHLPMNGIEERDRTRVLLVGTDAAWSDVLREFLSDGEGYRYESVSGGFEAGLRVRDYRPDVLVIDHNVGRTEAVAMVKSLRLHDMHRGVFAVALASEDETNPDWLSHCGYAAVFVKPFDINLLVKVVRARNDKL